ncbi:IS66-like element accessory protein TnpA [Acidiphilium multivorum]|uniref:IS66-like element accessory protein TnpA n=1 Tax=Acidiphilium multivorum TaxID=62140 RepID=UPI0038D078D5
MVRGGGRMEIITGVERRRRWRDEDKLRIVAEAEAPGAVFALVAQHEISRGQLWKWRGQVRRGELVPVPMVPEFIPVRVMASAALSMPRAAGKSASVNDASVDPMSQRRATRCDASRIEIVLPDGTCVRVDDGVGGAALRRVLTAVRR